MPYKSFAQSARVLDNKRLGKQRVENLQIMGALLDPTKGWSNHPATNMWRGHESALLMYQGAICAEWASRGFKDTCWLKTVKLLALNTSVYDAEQKREHMPPWLGLKAFHSGHRSNLLRKDPTHYGQFGWTDDPANDYYWPVQ